MRIVSILAVSIGIVLLMAFPVFAYGAPYSVSGVVTDVHGNPVNGANVTLVDINNEKTLAITQTNGTGNYEFINLTADNRDDMVSVRVSYNDGDKTYKIPDNSIAWYLAVGNIIVNSSQTQFPNYPPSTGGTISGTTYSISGIVMDVHGNPVKGANVTLIDDDKKTLAVTYTNGTGNYVFINPSGSNRDIVSVRVSYNDGNKTYTIPDYFTTWYPAVGNTIVNSSQTQFPDYPPATEGYVKGTLYSNATQFGENVDGDIFLISLSDKTQYHQIVNASNSSYFIFHVPQGKYDIYSTRMIGDLQYTSETQHIDVTPSWTSDYLNSTNSGPFTVIYMEPGSRQVIQPSPTIAANTSALSSSSGLPNIPVKSAVEVTAGGAAVVSCVYLIFKFFGIGSVMRAGSRIDKNKNRNDLLKYIADNPGVTLHELAHDLGMNIGTIRYHLFILEVNHRIVSSKCDDKFVRYFTNSGSFTKNEQLVISLARREGTRKVLSLLLNKPGLTNAQISNSLNIQVSATSRYTKELLEKGLIAKITQDNGALGYSINNDQKDSIIGLLKRVENGRQI